MASACNSRTNDAYAKYLRQRRRIIESSSSSSLSSSSLTPTKSVSTSASTTTSHASASTTLSLPPFNVVQLRLLCNPFSPLCHYFAYNFEYSRNDSRVKITFWLRLFLFYLIHRFVTFGFQLFEWRSSAGQLDGPMLTTLPTPPRVYQLTRDKSASVPSAASLAAAAALGNSAVDVDVVVASPHGINALLAIDHPFPWCDPPPPVPLQRMSLLSYELPNVSLMRLV